MTPDEDPFITALVADPADETTRLVYADWLDELGDGARATYLRAEVAHVRTQVAEFRSPLRKHKYRWYKTQGVDPVWEGMVGRMPFGILKSGLTFRDTGPEITRADLVALEGQRGKPLPPDYAAFLLLYNGGVPEPPYLACFMDEDGNTWYAAVRFFRLGETDATGQLYHRPIMWKRGRYRGERRAAPISVTRIGALTLPGIRPDGTADVNLLALLPDGEGGERYHELEEGGVGDFCFAGEDANCWEDFRELLDAIESPRPSESVLPTPTNPMK